jgi:hypothetical protein
MWSAGVATRAVRRETCPKERSTDRPEGRRDVSGHICKCIVNGPEVLEITSD